jgi:hypothetical protein
MSWQEDKKREAEGGGADIDHLYFQVIARKRQNAADSVA